jgi:LysM repeat protein
VDWGHRHILIDYPSGEIGAGIALAENRTVYYTVNIRPGQQASSVTPEPNTPVPFVPYLTSTPNEDGNIIHIVSEGQTLWSIAQSYGVTVDEIRQLNSMPAESADIYPGQQLLIRMGITMTPVLLDGTPTVSSQAPEFTITPFTKKTAPTDTVTPIPSATLHPSPTLTESAARIFSINLLKNKDIALDNPGCCIWTGSRDYFTKDAGGSVFDLYGLQESADLNHP